MSITKSPEKKRIKYVTGADLGSPPSVCVSTDTVDWSKCILCAGTAATSSSPLKCPANNPVAAQRYKCYSSLA